MLQGLVQTVVCVWVGDSQPVLCVCECVSMCDSALSQRLWVCGWLCSWVTPM